MIPSISEVSFRELCIDAMSELIASGEIDERDRLPEITVETFARQLVETAKSIVIEDGETSEEYVSKLVYFAAKDAIESAAIAESSIA